MYKRKVLSHRGIIDADQVVPGDYLYEYGTSKMLEIKYIDVRHHEKLYDMRYSDNRIEKVGESEKILFGDKIYNVWDIPGKVKEYIPMRRYVVDFGKLIPPVKPDSYSAGAILGYGTIADVFISIPADKIKVLDHILYVNGWDVYPEAADVIYFQELGTSDKLTWKDVFKCGTRPMDMFMINYHINSPIIPDEYRVNTPEERVKFIRGVFDTGYSKDINPDKISITHYDDIRLKTIQRMLWALGIMSFIHSSNGIFQLDIIGPEQDYAGFFYDIENRARMINTDYDVYKCDPTFELYLESVMRSLMCSDETCYYFETEKPHAIYYSDQYLPRVAL